MVYYVCGLEESYNILKISTDLEKNLNSSLKIINLYQKHLNPFRNNLNPSGKI